MRTRLAIHFAFVSFALFWALSAWAGVPARIACVNTVAFAAGSALVGWLAGSGSSRVRRALLVLGWTPLLGFILSVVVAVAWNRGSEEVVALGTVSSLGLLPIYLPVALLTGEVVASPR
jgi:hypothetical protein